MTVAEGRVELWGGWALTLTGPCHVTTNPDGSWSAWDADHTVDVTIVEVGGHQSGRDMGAEEMLGTAPTVSGTGWLGITELFSETDGDGATTRFMLTAAATNKFFSCTVSARGSVEMEQWSKPLIAELQHTPVERQTISEPAPEPERRRRFRGRH
jgi:hypothetical protein